MSELRFDCQGLGLVARNEASILVFDTKPVLYRPVLDQIQFCSFDRGCKTCLDTKPVLDHGRFCSLTYDGLFIAKIKTPYFTPLCIHTLCGLTHWGSHSSNDILKCIFLNENARISLAISLKFVSRGPIIYIPAFVQIMAWRRPGDKPLSEPMMVSLLTHICVIRPQWVKEPKSIILTLYNTILYESVFSLSFSISWT